MGPPPSASGRRDAQRNATRVLDAASTIVGRCGAKALTMDAVADQAGVGKGTVFRRFGNRAGLMAALVDHIERDLQERFMTGPPPLGPGAPPLDRLLAFGAARLEIVAAQGPLMIEIGDVGRRFDVPAHTLALTHVRLLLRALEVDGDVELLASALMAPLDPALVALQRERGMSLERLVAGWHDLVRRVVRVR
ncbi:TetR family transcriptional regulator [Luteipulveratus halotolerans]|uniref:TetR family transcriptional regulator n=2 Tax=Luteipulveratus halotolerans TaxID=1631356 RepID=A0A0L6CFH3_9MICO|nr:TetR family transcriptional regulator [Luteipulveratus halotolerans]